MLLIVSIAAMTTRKGSIVFQSQLGDESEDELHQIEANSSSDEGGNDQRAIQEIRGHIEKETKAVRFTRVVIAFVAFIVASLVTLKAYDYARQLETEAFESSVSTTRSKPRCLTVESNVSGVRH